MQEMHMYQGVPHRKKSFTPFHTLSHNYQTICQFQSISTHGYQKYVLWLKISLVILSYTHSRTLMQYKCNFNAIFSHNCAILAIYVLISTFLVSKSIYMSCKIHLKYFHIPFLTHSHTFIQLISIFIQFFAEFGYFSQFQHIGYQKVCTLAQKFFGDTFITHLHTFMQSKCNLNTFFVFNCAI